MPASNTRTPEQGPLTRLAQALDSDFSGFERLSEQLERLEIESDNGLEHGRELLGRFSEHGLRIGEGISALAQALDEARRRAEKAAEAVSSRAAAIQARQQKCDLLASRFGTLGEMVRGVTTLVAQLQKPGHVQLSDAEKASLFERLPELDLRLGTLFDEARKLKEEAREANMKLLERNADALGQGLQSVRSKLGKLPGVASYQIAQRSFGAILEPGLQPNA